VVTIAATALAFRLYRIYGDPPYAGRVLAETELTDTSVTVRFEVRSRSGTQPGVCRVRARGFDGGEVGAADVEVPAGKVVEHTYTLPTTARSALVDIPGCAAAPPR
jgi:hypothetical protein